MCREAAFEMNMTNAIFDISKFVACAVGRSKLIKEVMELDATTEPTFDDKEDETPWYRLKKTDEKSSEYTQVVLDGVYVAEFPRTHRITDEWIMKEKLSLQYCCLYPPPGSGLSAKQLKGGLNMLELFVENNQVLKFVEALTMLGPEVAVASVEGASASASAPAAAAAAPPPDEMQMKLSPAKLKQLVEMKKKKAATD